MSHAIDWYDDSACTGRLPVSVLANGDIEVAYLELDSGIIPARALVVQSTQTVRRDLPQQRRNGQRAW